MAKKLNQLIEVLVGECQTLETVFSQLLTERNISNAVGVQLDTVGEIVNLSRNGLTDSEYRNAIRVKVRINNGGGTPDSVIDALRFFTDATNVEYTEVYPAGIRLFTNGGVVPSTLYDGMRNLVPVGVGFSITQISETPFVLSNVNNDFVTGDGFSELETPASGGSLAQIIV